MLDTKYNHIEVEKNKYETWKNKGYFKSGDLNKLPFSIVIPPPNVTGKLHLGHAWDTTIQDIIIRYKRMNGYDALWLPGMDHAGIATQAKVDKKLKELGFKPREMNRDEWLKKAWEWKEEYANSIHDQWAKLGLSLDYSKERFTLDKGLNEAVNYVFINLYNKGYIYKGERPINWDPEAKTALSNEEVIYQEEKGKMYYFKYYIEGTNDYVEVATTRPETLGADTALVVNPKDSRYKHLIGKKVITPLRKVAVPVITDEYIDIDFGTGAMKCSAHATEDVRILKENNIPIQECINEDGLLNANCLEFEGMTREEGKIAIVSKLKKENLLIKEEDHIHQVGHSERTSVPVEIMIMPQWFVKMDTLAKQVLDNQKTENKVNFVPTRFEKILTHWMEDCHDWCISRQLWWGHRIPAWYKDDLVKVEVESPGDGWIQDSDVLDTWFSSALWPFSTLGFPDITDDFKRYFPTDVLVTGYDIIFFWVCRMVFQGLEFTKNRPFKECLIHGLIRDKEGRKMSKSLGNGVDPMDMIELYGADALRYYLATSTSPGLDLRFEEEKIKSTWNFINKLWNASRFTLMNLEGFDKNNYSLDNLDLSSKWILTKLSKTIKEVKYNMEKYEFNNASTILYSFIWDNFCDWYIELSKFNMNNVTKSVLIKVLTDILKLLHPFMPYVTEEIYLLLPIHDESIMISEYPSYSVIYEEENTLDSIINFIQQVRKIKLENNISKDYYINTTNQKLLENITLICQILKLDVGRINSNINLTKIDFNFEGSICTIIYDGSSNMENLKEQLLKEKEVLENSINRRTSLLNNENYTKKAPSNIVLNDKNLLEKELKDLELLKEKLKNII